MGADSVPRPPNGEPPTPPPVPEGFDPLYEFESWPLNQLQTTVDLIRRHGGTARDVLALDDAAWAEVAGATELDPDKLRDAVLRELRGIDLQQINTGDEVATSVQGALFIGTLGSAENRFALHFFQIRKILALFSSSVDHTWESDGLEYKEVVLDASNELLPYIDSAVDFIGRGHRYGGVNVLVCCGTGIRRSASLCAAYLMSLDDKSGPKLARALKSLYAQRASVDISGGDCESVGGDGKGLYNALEMYEWELNAEAASGPCSPAINGRRHSGSFGEGHVLEVPKRKSPHLGAAQEACESPGTKKVKAATNLMEEITL